MTDPKPVHLHEDHFSENISLDELLSMTTFGKSYLLRSFYKAGGRFSYRYLQTIRLDKAKNSLNRACLLWKQRPYGRIFRSEPFHQLL